MSDTAATYRSRFGRLPGPKKRVAGQSRGAIYELAKKHRGLLLKNGAATILDLERLDQILAQLPPANIRIPSTD